MTCSARRHSEAVKREIDGIRQQNKKLMNAFNQLMEKHAETLGELADVKDQLNSTNEKLDHLLDPKNKRAPISFSKKGTS